MYRDKKYKAKSRNAKNCNIIYWKEGQKEETGSQVLVNEPTKVN